MKQVNIWGPSSALSSRVKRLRDEYFDWENRSFRNEVLSYTTGAAHDSVYRRHEDYVVPEVVPFMRALEDSLLALAEPVALPSGFWEERLIVRRALFFAQVLRQIPVDILEGDLVAGSRFNTALSNCLNEQETDEYCGIERRESERTEWLIRHGVSNCGPVPSHIVQDFPTVLRVGFKGIKEEAEQRLQAETDEARRAFYRAVIICCDVVREFSGRYAHLARQQAEAERSYERRQELLELAEVCDRVPYLPAESFYEAVQSVWFTHMVDMIAESYPGAGLSYGRFDQYLYPYYQRDVESGKVSREQAKEILECFWIKHNYAYDRFYLGGRHGINSGFGQLITLGGCAKNGEDATNDLTYLVLDVIEEMNMLEPKRSVRLHNGTPPKLMRRVCEMISQAQGAPFLLNFDRMSILALEKEGISHDEAVDYGIVGCIENTSHGNDLSGTVDVNVNLAKAVELALNNGKCMVTGDQIGPMTGDPVSFASYDQFLDAVKAQLKDILLQTIDVYSSWDALRARFLPVPYLSSHIGGCMENAKDVRAGGAKYNFITVEGCSISTLTDSVAAVKKLVFDEKLLSVSELVAAVKADFAGYEPIRQMLVNRAPKFGNDDDYVDAIGRELSRFWSEEVGKHVSLETGRRYTAGYLSWNYFISFAEHTAATPDGRHKGEHLSNAVAPVQGRDMLGPTAAIKSVTRYGFDVNPRGASYTITLSPSVLEGEPGLERLAALLRTYEELGGTSIQINVIDKETLLAAQAEPEKYSNLLVRVTGYNAYFVTLGRGMQEEIIARTAHGTI
jgi:pyruvate formate-lyase/glycerol dehydratase family glycyl radical enzyme